MAYDLSPVGFLKADQQQPIFDSKLFDDAVSRIRRPVHIVRHPVTGVLGLATEGQLGQSATPNGSPQYSLMASLPALYPEWLGDRSFAEVHGVRFPYVAGAMANGIASPELVLAMADAGMLAFFGAAGLSLSEVESGLEKIQTRIGERPWGSNLIHSPIEPEMEDAIVDLYLRRGVTKVSAAAYMRLTPAVVRYALTGLQAGEGGRVHRRNRLFAKISRPEVAGRFLSPAPQDIVEELVEKGLITAEEANLASRIPLAEDITVESDSGGHTDNRPLGSLFPAIAQLRDELAERFGYLDPIRLGAAGGLGSPTAVAAAFALGAAYVLTGSVNQGAIESGMSPEGKRMLAKADLADVIMAPAADMFEMGVKVQVLRRGTMFGLRALKVYKHYVSYDSLAAMPDDVRERLEKDVLGESCDTIWQEVVSFFQERDPDEITRAKKDPKHQMALVFRWYLGLSSRWAIGGVEKGAVIIKFGVVRPWVASIGGFKGAF